MNFIVNEMMKFEHVNATDGNAIEEGKPGSAVKKNGFAVGVEMSKVNGGEKVVIACAVENGSGDIKTCLSGHG